MVSSWDADRLNDWLPPPLQYHIPITVPGAVANPGTSTHTLCCTLTSGSPGGVGESVLWGSRFRRPHPHWIWARPDSFVTWRRFFGRSSVSEYASPVRRPGQFTV